MSSITERAAAVIKAEAAARLVADQATQAAAASAAAEKDRLEREARIIAAAERQQALLRAERLEAEQTAAAAAAAEQTALAAEVARLRARTPLEVLQDEMAEMKRQMASRPTAPQQQLRMDGELDMRFKSSRQETAALREELVALHAHARRADKAQSEESRQETAAMREELAALHAQNKALCEALAPALAEIKQLKHYMLWLADTHAAPDYENLRIGQWANDTKDIMRSRDSSLPPFPKVQIDANGSVNLPRLRLSPFFTAP